MCAHWISWQNKLFDKAGQIINAVYFSKALYAEKLGDTLRTEKCSIDMVNAIGAAFTRSHITAKLNCIKTKQFIIAGIYKTGKIQWNLKNTWKQDFHYIEL